MAVYFRRGGNRASQSYSPPGKRERREKRSSEKRETEYPAEICTKYDRIESYQLHVKSGRDQGACATSKEGGPNFVGEGAKSQIARSVRVISADLR